MSEAETLPRLPLLTDAELAMLWCPNQPTPWLCRLVRWTPDSPVGGFGIFAEGRRRLICGNGIVDPGNGHEPFMSGEELERMRH